VRPKFYRIGPKASSRATGYTLLNGDRLFPGYGGPDATPEERCSFLKPGVSFVDFPEVPVFQSEAKLRGGRYRAPRSRSQEGRIH
jgi:hypothetical protein